MNDDLLEKYNEYKQATRSGISNKEIYKLLANFAATNPSRCKRIFRLTKRRKGPK